jgi:ribulose-phosphate 3-epimerase
LSSSPEISVSVLSGNLSDLKTTTKLIEAQTDWVHADVMDGHFVPNLTFGNEVVAALAKQTAKPVEAHLMIEDPDRWAVAYAKAGAKRVIFHLEAAKDPRGIIKQLREQGAEVGIAIKPATPVASLKPFLGEIDMALVMTVEPGFAGQKLIPETLEKVAEVKRLVADLPTRPRIQVDGGINEETISKAAQSGADVFVSASAVYGAQDPAAMAKHLRELAASNRD